MPVRLSNLSLLLIRGLAAAHNHPSAFIYLLTLPLKGQLSCKRETKEMMTMTHGVIGPM